MATYNTAFVDVFAEQRGQIFFDTTPVTRYAVVPDLSGNYDFLLNMQLSEPDGNDQFLCQEGIKIDLEANTALFSNIIPPTPTSQMIDESLFGGLISSIEFDEEITVVGLSLADNGQGRILILDSQTLLPIN